MGILMRHNMRRAAKFELLVQQPTYQQLRRLFDADSIKDVRGKDIFGCIREKIGNLLYFLSEIFKSICANERDVAKEPQLEELVSEFTHICLDTLNFYSGLAESLNMEKSEQDIIGKELQNVAPGGPPLSEAQVNKIKENFMDFFKSDKDPLKNLCRQYEPLLERYKRMKKMLEVKMQKLGRKRKAAKVWKTILAVVTAATAVTCVVVVVVAPPTAPAVAAALTLYAASMGFLGEMVLSSMEKCELKQEEELSEKMKQHTSGVPVDLLLITNSVKGLNRFRAPIVFNVQKYLKDGDILDLADIADNIKKLQEPLLQKLDDLGNDVGRCIMDLEELLKSLKQR